VGREQAKLGGDLKKAPSSGKRVDVKTQRKQEIPRPRCRVSGEWRPVHTFPVGTHTVNRSFKRVMRGSLELAKVRAGGSGEGTTQSRSAFKNRWQ